MENCDLTRKIELLIAENETLKNKNFELSKKLGELKNWSGIREGELLPRLRKRYGYIGPCGSSFINPISQIIREILGVNKISEINETNHDKAREISIGLIDEICKYDWPKLEELKERWKRTDFKNEVY